MIFNNHHIDKIIHLKSRLDKLYIHLLIHSFGISMIFIFEPIYLIQIGFDLKTVFTYLLIEWTFYGVFMPIYAKIIHKYGIKEIIFIRTPFYIAGLLLLLNLNNYFWLKEYYYIVPILLGISSGIYTISITALFAECINKNHYDTEVAKLLSFPRIASMVGPFIGGFIIGVFGFNVLVFIVISLLILSILPLSFIKHNINHPKFHIHIYKNTKHTVEELIMLIVYGIISALFTIIIPVILYLNKQNTISLGFIMFLISFIGVLFSIKVTKYMHMHGVKKTIKIGVFSISTLLITMGYFINSIIFLFLSLLSGKIYLSFQLPYEAHLYMTAKTTDSPIGFLVFKEFSLWIGRFIFYSTLILIPFATNLSYIFYLTAIIALIFLIPNFESKD